MATNGPDVVATLGVGLGQLRALSSAQLANTVASLINEPGVIAHSGHYSTAYSAIRFGGQSDIRF
jgi:hypothetical protein